jgi:hypothetical protein
MLTLPMPHPIHRCAAVARTFISSRLRSVNFRHKTLDETAAQQQCQQRDSDPRMLGLLLSLVWLPGLGIATQATSSQATAAVPLTLIAQTRIAQTSPNAPPELQKLISQLDSAASQQDMATVLKFYGQGFSTSDGLNRQTLEPALKKFWQDFPTLVYRTEINSWQATPEGFMAETTTTITGKSTKDREFTLKSTLKSKQRFVGNTIVSQEILQESTRLTAGETPPTVELSLPTQVKVGQEFNLDAIVQQPLGDSLLVGAAVETKIAPELYLKSPPPELELLSAGGIYKVGKAPSQPGDRWVSIALIWDSGITLITQRLKVVQ